MVADDVTRNYIRENNSNTEDLHKYYGENKYRRITYEEIVDRTLDHIRDGKLTLLIFYGHPGVFAHPTYEGLLPVGLKPLQPPPLYRGLIALWHRRICVSKALAKPKKKSHRRQVVWFVGKQSYVPKSTPRKQDRAKTFLTQRERSAFSLP